MSKLNNLSDFLTDVANAIREKTEEQEPINAQDFSSKIKSIKTGGGELRLDGKYIVKVLDFDGTIIKQENLNTGDIFELPNPPSHSRLVFQEWVSSVDIIDNKIEVKNSDINIGAIYGTKSGLTEIDVVLTSTSGKAVTLNMDGTKNWGDGTVDTTNKHTYNDYGEYTITCDGTTMTTSSSSRLFGQAATGNVTVINIFFNNISKITQSALQYCYCLKTITLPNTVTNIYASGFDWNRSLSTIVLPNQVVSIASTCFTESAITTIVLPKNITKLPSSFLKNGKCSSIVLTDNITTISDNALYYNTGAITKIKMPSSITSIGTGAFQGCYALREIDFSDSTVIPTLAATATFSNLSDTLKIIVPDSLYNSWIAATNWSAKSSYIYKRSEVLL